MSSNNVELENCVLSRKLMTFDKEYDHDDALTHVPSFYMAREYFVVCAALLLYSCALLNGAIEFEARKEQLRFIVDSVSYSLCFFLNDMYLRR